MKGKKIMINTGSAFGKCNQKTVESFEKRTKGKNKKSNKRKGNKNKGSSAVDATTEEMREVKANRRCGEFRGKNKKSKKKEKKKIFWKRPPRLN